MIDEIVVPKEILQAVFDCAVSSMDFGSGFLDNAEVEALRHVADLLGVDPIVATPSNFVCQYKKAHQWRKAYGFSMKGGAYQWICPLCHHTSETRPPEVSAEEEARQDAEHATEQRRYEVD